MNFEDALTSYKAACNFYNAEVITEEVRVAHLHALCITTNYPFIKQEKFIYYDKNQFQSRSMYASISFLLVIETTLKPFGIPSSLHIGLSM